MDLTKLQDQVAHALFDPSPDLRLESDNVLSQGELDSEQRLEIYRNSSRGILKQHLAAVFAVAESLVGQQRFTVLCNAFIDERSPATPYLADYGDCFADFLDQQASLKPYPYIADVARLEWTRHKAWHGVNQQAGDFSQLAQLNEQAQAQVCFELPTSAALLHSKFAVHAIWMAHQLEDAQAISKELSSLSLNQEAYVIVWRQGRHLKQSELNHGQWRFLQCVQRRDTLQLLSEAFDSDVSTHLATAVQQGWVCNFN
ncbi:DUF2063 domain-containing protein [Leucothrix sargassi]|nr:DUF2063 domain-containing protein [Leucothrix sargassi]